MTAKEKAEELFNKADMIIYTDQDWKSQCKQVAILVCNQILSLCWNGNEVGFKYWNDVKQEIENL